MPAAPETRFFFDYVDPASFLVERVLSSIERGGGAKPDRIPFELCPPPARLIDPAGEPWLKRWSRANTAARGESVSLIAPRLVPWSRKAHELAFHAREQGTFEPVHRALFEAFHLHGQDLGRVDVLLTIAVRFGLDLTHTKAILDVDRHTAEVDSSRDEAERLGIPGVPALLASNRWLVGLQDRDTLLAFLRNRARE